MQGEKIFITGGAGFLGKNLIKKLYPDNQITVYSRDEAKHYFLKREFPKVNFIIGDVRDRDLIVKSSRNHTRGIFAASLKQIEACSENFTEASKIIINGSFNSRDAAEYNNFKSACFVSTDKSRAATTIYGAMKYVAGESFISGKSECNLSTAIYGNVTNSTGSIIPLIWNSIEKKTEIYLYNTEMTRFLLDIEDAVSLIIKSTNYGGCNIIPNSKSFKILDLFEIYKEEFGLCYKLSNLREGEKIHECMASSEETRRMEFIKKDNLYVLHQKFVGGGVYFKNGEYSSQDLAISREELYLYLREKNFFRQ
jgi:UDP-glucose 4-epimerase